jgi:probable F420-dependent oxidoreductase
MQFMFQYPDVHGIDGDMLDAGPIVELAQTAERTGWDGISFTEHPAPGANWLAAGGHQTLDPFVALAAAAAVTTRLRLLTYLAVVPYRNPLLLAKTAASVDKVSGGRFILGTGTGYLKSEFHALGVDFEERNELFDEALDVLPLHWSGKPFSYQGKHFNARDVIARPAPVRQPIPIWIGGNAKITLQRVATKAQGWMPLTGPASMANTTRSPHLESIDSITERLAMLRELAGERFATLDLAVSYTDPTIHQPGVDTARHHEALDAYRQMGATWIVVAGPTGRHPLARDFLEAFAGEYIPK